MLRDEQFLMAVKEKPNALVNRRRKPKAGGTNIGHQNREAMAYVGVRVEPTVRLGRAVEGESSVEAWLRELGNN